VRAAAILTAGWRRGHRDAEQQKVVVVGICHLGGRASLGYWYWLARCCFDAGRWVDCLSGPAFGRIASELSFIAKQWGVRERNLVYC
jgi:hypothetical protein